MCYFCSASKKAKLLSPLPSHLQMLQHFRNSLFDILPPHLKNFICFCPTHLKPHRMCIYKKF